MRGELPNNAYWKLKYLQTTWAGFWKEVGVSYWANRIDWMKEELLLFWLTMFDSKISEKNGREIVCYWIIFMLTV